MVRSAKHCMSQGGSCKATTRESTPGKSKLMQGTPQSSSLTCQCLRECTIAAAIRQSPMYQHCGSSTGAFRRLPHLPLPQEYSIVAIAPAARHQHMGSSILAGQCLTCRCFKERSAAARTTGGSLLCAGGPPEACITRAVLVGACCCVCPMSACSSGSQASSFPDL